MNLDLEKLHRDAIEAFMGVENIEDLQSIEAHVESLLSRHLKIILKTQVNLMSITEEQFNYIKTQCLSTIHNAYLTVAGQIVPITREDHGINSTSNTEVESTNVNESRLSGMVALSETEIQAITRQVATQFKKAFWDKVADDFRANPVRFDHFRILLGEICERLNNLTPNNRRIIEENRENLDSEYIHRQLSRTDSLNIELLTGIVHFVVQDRLPKLIAPINDIEYADWAKTVTNLLDSDAQLDQVVTQIFKGVYRWLEQIESGMALLYMHSRPPNNRRL